MVLILVGNSEYAAHACAMVTRGVHSYCKKNKFPICGGKCLGQIKLPNLLFMCAPFSELPTNISTMMADEDVV